jgi:5-methylcytosine-specific restriction enzyme subunit McrC
MPMLFEYDNEISIDDPESLKNYLHRIWQEQYIPPLHEKEEEKSFEDNPRHSKNYQPFLSFDGKLIRAKNYVGFIQMDNLHLEI